LYENEQRENHNRLIKFSLEEEKTWIRDENAQALKKYREMKEREMQEELSHVQASVDAELSLFEQEQNTHYELKMQEMRDLHAKEIWEILEAEEDEQIDNEDQMRDEINRKLALDQKNLN